MVSDLNKILSEYREELRLKLIENIGDDSEFTKIVSIITQVGGENGIPNEITRLAALIEDLSYAINKFNNQEDNNNQPEE